MTPALPNMSDEESPIEHVDDILPEDVASPLPLSAKDNHDDLSDVESQLSEVDEDQFEGFDPTAVPLERQALPQAPSKRRRGADGEDDARRRNKREGRREKPKRQRRRRGDRNDSEPFSGGEELAGKRIRKPGRPDGEAPVRKVRQEVAEESLTPAERRKRALDRAMDDALRGPNTRRNRKGDIDLEALADQEIEDCRTRMAKAAEADTDARAKGQPASHKLAMLPQVVALINKNTLRHQIVDPDINLLESVRFFLEPLNDGSLPAYNIQKELFLALAKLPINKDTLIASGIGKVVLFYTKSSRAEPAIKRQAERLITRWTGLLKRRAATPPEQDEHGQVILPDRARHVLGAGVYSIAPVSKAVPIARMQQGTDLVRRLQKKQAAKAGSRR